MARALDFWPAYLYLTCISFMFWFSYYLIFVDPDRMFEAYHNIRDMWAAANASVDSAMNTLRSFIEMMRN
ncbi:MAG: hypothetical protein ACPGVT_05310 [Maricaulaceae bacterium]